VNFVRTMLELSGHRVTHTASLYNGIELARQQPTPDLVLLDLSLPDGDGLDFLQQSDLRHLPVLAMTAGMTSDLDRQLQAANVFFFVKPISACARRPHAGRDF
jgi:CheY-like chemotaxis protein